MSDSESSSDRRLRAADPDIVLPTLALVPLPGEVPEVIWRPDWTLGSFWAHPATRTGAWRSATAMIDRLIHHSEILPRNGDSYRLRGKDLDPRIGANPPKSAVLPQGLAKR